MDVKIDGEALGAALHAAILQSLGDNAREMIVTETVRYLTTKNVGGYGADKDASPLQAAVHRAAERVAIKLVEEQLLGDKAFQDQIKSLYVEATARFFSAEHREKLVERLSSKLTEAFSARF